MSTPPGVADRFAENLCRARRRAGLSQEALGLTAALHRTEIGLLERGSRIPRIDTLVKLAGALGVAPETLLNGIVWGPAEISTGGFDLTSEGRPGSGGLSDV